MTQHPHCYVVLLPKGFGNDTDKHLVVDTGEYVDVTRHGKPGFDFSTEHDDYDSASTDRDRLNKEHHQWKPPTPLSTKAQIPQTTNPQPAPAPGKPEADTSTHPSTATTTPTTSTAPAT